MQTALEAVLEYYKAFSTLEMRAITAYYFEPSMTIAPQGVVSAANHAALANTLAPLLDALRAKNYGRSEFVQPTVTSLGEATSLVRGVAVRYTAAGSEMVRIPLAYLMRHTEAGWKIAVLIAES